MTAMTAPIAPAARLPKVQTRIQFRNLSTSSMPGGVMVSQTPTAEPMAVAPRYKATHGRRAVAVLGMTFSSTSVLRLMTVSIPR